MSEIGAFWRESQLHPAKRALVLAQEVSGMNRWLHYLQVRALWPFIRAINYHGIEKRELASLDAQFSFFAREFVPVNLERLLMLYSGHWTFDKPGILISFDDGLRSHFQHAAPMLERHGLSGWFFVPTGFVSMPSEEQRAFARAHSITEPLDDPEPRIAMTWEELRNLDRRGHVVGSHTISHHRLTAASPTPQLRAEIFGSRAVIEEQLGHEANTFCWVGGEERTYSAEAARLIREAGYRVAFMTNNQVIRPGSNLLQLQRTNIEARDPLPVVRFQISGTMDILYTPKRRRVVRLTES